MNEYLKGTGEDYKILITPDHATPLALKTHTNDPVPFMIYCSNKPQNGVEHFNENTAKETGLYVETGHSLMNKFIND